MTDILTIHAREQEARADELAREVRELRARAEQAEAVLARKVGLQDYLRLMAKYRDAMGLIARHERTIADQMAEIERLREVSNG